MSDTYRDVDASGHVAEAIEWQERIDRWPVIAAYKARMDLYCGGLDPIIDVGAGPGADALRVGAIAMDRSQAMARNALVRGVPSVIADALQLPIASGAVGAVRSDRVLQHLDDPRRVVAELHRCVRPGGRLVICDPDQTTLSIKAPGVDADLTERIRQRRRDVGYRNGTYVSRLPGWLATLGCEDVTLENFRLVLGDPRLAFGIQTWAAAWADPLAIGAAEVAAWERGIASRPEGFEYAVTYRVVSGVVPS